MAITLQAEGGYGSEGKQYVARITGRDSKFTFAREFIGRRTGKRNEYTEVTVDDAGLYETCDVGKKGKDNTYHVVAEVDGALVATTASQEDVMALAKGASAEALTEYVIRDQIAYHEQRIATSTAKGDLDAVIEVKNRAAIGAIQPWARVSRRELIAARQAEVARLKGLLGEGGTTATDGRPAPEIVLASFRAWADTMPGWSLLEIVALVSTGATR